MGALNCWRRLPARSATVRSRSATATGTPLPFSASCECSSRPATVVFNSVSMAAAAARRASVCSRSRRLRAARISRTRRGRSRDGEVDLHGNGQAGVFADLLRGRRIALGQGFVDHHGQETRGAAMRPAPPCAPRPLRLPCPVALPPPRRSCARLRFPSPSECSCPFPDLLLELSAISFQLSALRSLLFAPSP